MLEGDKVLVYKLELMDRGRLNKSVASWTDPHMLGEKKIAFNWEVTF